MSLDINALAASQPAAAVAAAPSSSDVAPGTVSAVVMSDEPVTVDMIPAVPPSEVLDAVRAASATYDKLVGSGRAVHFATNPQSGRVSIQVLDMSGTSLGAMSPSAVVHLATSGELHMTPPATSSAAAIAKTTPGHGATSVSGASRATTSPATGGTLA